MARKAKASKKKRKRHAARNAIGTAVTRLRKAAKLTRKDLAARAYVGGWEIEAHVIVDIERGSREVTDIEVRALAKALRVPISVLFE